MFHDLAILSALSLVSAVAVVICVVPSDASVSISQRVASTRRTYLLFAISITVFGGIFSYYLYEKVGAQRGLPEPFYSAVIGDWLAMMLTAWIPIRSGPGNFRDAHSLVAVAMGLFMTLTMATVPFASHTGTVVRYIAVLTTLWYSCTIYLAIFRPHSPLHKYYLLFQLTNLLSFLTIMLSL